MMGVSKEYDRDLRYYAIRVDIAYLQPPSIYIYTIENSTHNNEILI